MFNFSKSYQHREIESLLEDKRKRLEPEKSTVLEKVDNFFIAPTERPFTYAALGAPVLTDINGNYKSIFHFI